MKKNLVLLLASGFLIVSPFISYSSEEQIHSPYEVSLTANADAPFGETKVIIHTSPSQETSSKITSIDLWVNGKAIPIPKAAYADLEAPLLGSTQIRSESGYDQHPWLYIYFELTYRMDNGEWRPKRVHIAYHNDKIEYRAIDTPSSDGSYTWKKDNL